MKLNFFRGCINQSCEIEGKNISEYDDNYLWLLLRELYTRQDLENAIQEYIEDHGEWANRWICEQCGDINIEYELKI